jgi:hypothetical protein
MLWGQVWEALEEPNKAEITSPRLLQSNYFNRQVVFSKNATLFSSAAFSNSNMGNGLEAKPFVFLFEFGHTATGIHQAGAATGPGRMNRRVNFQRQGFAFGAIGRFHFNHSAVSHFDVDRVVVWMDVFSHSNAP